MSPPPFAGFETHRLSSHGETVFARGAGTGPVVLLLHGFPETGDMWHEIAPLLIDDFTVLVADLPGYGRSSCPADMSKRALARLLLGALSAAGHNRTAIVGHDRGGRVAYRAALDHPDRVAAVAVLDVVPTAEVWARADARLALDFWPFSLLAQPAPLPEKLLAAVPEAVVDDALDQWGSPPSAFPGWLREAYIAALRDPARVHAICEEYRAAATTDRQHDEADLASGHRISCPLLALWSGSGALAKWYGDAGGPLGLWRRWADRVQGEAVAGGHFFPEEYPVETAERLRVFLRRAFTA